MPEAVAAETTSGTTGANVSSAQGGDVAVAQPQIFVDENGKFKEGWRQHYVPEDIRSDKVFDTVSDLNGMTKMLAHQVRTIRSQGKAMPEETAPKSDWDVFFKSIGRPDTPEGYKYVKPEDINVEDLSPEFMKTTFAGFHKTGMNQKQAESVLGMFADHLREVEKFVDAEENREFDEAEQALRQKWGTAYDSHMHLAQKMVAENTQGWPPADKERLLDALADNASYPYVMDMLANIAGKFMEHRIIPESEFMGGKTPKQVEGEITELKATPGFILPDKDGKSLKNYNRDEYNRLVEKLHNLEDELRSMTVKK
jgi:hypothetical protein